ncbi:hypothetical protein BDZ85DRAFT_255757 [Elsinoe ampelina]|uniref:PRISE-like Rossmann-fold domain-containing protein n=1 Tax=Elsinoe ampelina TaxID=302913 RepID=A0A6A6GS18_9PEZI|nr:hypothetical protein BDZ85DRAFT_255757 [Elsinoe ampelina]
MPGHHALVFGASGVSGWAITSQALQFPSNNTFSQVTALTNRPLSIEGSKLPQDDRLELVSGIDLTGSVESIVSGLKSKVKDVSSVSHVFFTAYIEKPSYPELVEINKRLVSNAISAISKVAGSSLKAVILQTGGKHYGVEFADKVNIQPPLKADAARIPSPIGDNIFYYNQYDVISDLRKGHSWNFYEVRPDVIVGFTPGSNFMNISQGLGFYFTLYRAVHGAGAEVPFVGTQKSWVNKHTDTFQDILAQQEIHISLNENNIPSGKSFNAANGDVTTWSDKWPALASYFGLNGVGPGSAEVDTAAFAQKHTEEWKKLEREHSLKPGIFEKYSWGFIKGVCVLFDFDRHYDLSETRNVGFNETIDTVKGYTTAFDRMRDAKILPTLD